MATKRKTPAKKRASRKTSAKKKAASKKKAAAKKSPAKPEVFSDDLDWLNEFEIERAEEEAARSRGDVIFLRPNKDQKIRSTRIRPVFYQRNKFGQDRSIIMYALHERLDQEIPGTGGKMLFPHIQDGIERLPCIEPRANRKKRKPQFCPICKRLPSLLQTSKQIGKKAESSANKFIGRFARSLNIILGGMRASDWVTFAAIHRINPKTAGENLLKRLVPLTIKDGKVVIARGEDRVKARVGPVGIVREKLYYMEETFLAKITEKAMPKEDYEEENGVELSEAEWKRVGPRARPNPFSAKNGWACRIKFAGKGLEAKVTIEVSAPKPLSKGEVVVVREMYPNVVDVATIPGTEDRVRDYPSYLSLHPDHGREEYANYLRGLAKKMEEILGIEKEEPGDSKIKISLKAGIRELNAGVSDDEDDEDDDEEDEEDINQFAVGTEDEEDVPF